MSALGRRALLSGALSGALTTVAACKSKKREVVVYTSVDQIFAEPVLRAYEKKSGVRVRAVFDTEETKSTGVVNRIIAEQRRPQADVFWSGDPVRPFLLIGRALTVPYVSPSAKGVPDAFRAADGAWTGLAARARVLLVSTKELPDAAAGPRSIRDLADRRYKGKCAIASPLFGTTTMHVAALVTAWGESASRAYLDAIKANGTRVVSSNGEVKRLVSSGEIAIGLTDTDDAHEAVTAGAPVRVVYPDQDALGALVMPTSTVLLAGPRPAEGKRLIDHLLSADVERELVASGAHMPLRAGVPRPEGVRAAADLRAMKVDYARVAKEMERIEPWLRAWVGL